MSKIINFQEYKTIFKLSKYIENLLNDNYVINHIRKNNAGIENIKLQNSYLQAQFEKVFNKADACKDCYWYSTQNDIFCRQKPALQQNV